jgi:hypothetical protein
MKCLSPVYKTNYVQTLQKELQYNKSCKQGLEEIKHAEGGKKLEITRY